MTTTRISLCATLLATVLAGCSTDSPGGLGGGAGDGDADCASILEYDGHEYGAWGDLKRTPMATGRVESGVLQGCDDGNGALGDETVQVEELADVATDRAVLVGGDVFVRTGRELPEQIRLWFEAPTCRGPTPFELAGAWLGVHTTREVRFDGDLRPPYRVEMRVASGPRRYAGTTIMVRATGATEPSLGPDDAASALWEGGTLRAEVVCRGELFVATSLTTSPDAPAAVETE